MKQGPVLSAWPKANEPDTCRAREPTHSLSSSLFDRLRACRTQRHPASYSSGRRRENCSPLSRPGWLIGSEFEIPNIRPARTQAGPDSFFFPKFAGLPKLGRSGGIRPSATLHHESGVDHAGRLSTENYHRGLGCNNFPQLVAARARSRRSRVTACSSKAARSTAPTDAWVGRTQAVGHRVTPFDRINSAIASQSSSDIFPLPSPIAPDGGVIPSASGADRALCVNFACSVRPPAANADVLAQAGSASTKPITITPRCSGNKPWTCGCCVQCLPILIDIRSRDDASLVRSGASFVDLRRFVDFRPFPKSAHLGIHRFTHDSLPLQNFRLRVLDRSRMP